MERWELEKRRARNLVWNAAGDYGFTPDPLAIDEKSEAVLYLNCILGALHRHYDWPQLSALLESVGEGRDGESCTALVWLGLEHCAYQRESPMRPALEELRRVYAKKILLRSRDLRDLPLSEAVEYAHCQRILGQEPKCHGRERTLLEAMEQGEELDTAQLVERLRSVLSTYFTLRTTKEEASWRNIRFGRLTPLFGLQEDSSPEGLSERRDLGLGRAKDSRGAPEGGDQKRLRLRLFGKKDPELLRSFVEASFGASCCTAERRMEWEQRLCTGSHQDCRLHFTRGEFGDVPSVKREEALAQREKNEAYYRTHHAACEENIARLADRIRSALQAYQEPEEISAAAGQLAGNRAWRAVGLGDRRVFTKTQLESKGDLSVDILLDSSSSQLHHQEEVAVQGYMIAEALNRCDVPTRVCSFCSLSGYTVFSRFREYEEREKNRNIFRYFSAGWNRDGLGIRTAAHLAEESPCSHRLLLILSDVNPNDDGKFPAGGTFRSGRDYGGKAAVEDTAAEVRKARRAGVSVLCVFTGKDQDVENAKEIYGSDFARIRAMDQFADVVGILIQNRIRLL